MAGNYPDVPSWRIPYDRMGVTIFDSTDQVVWNELPQDRLALLNDEDSDSGWTIPADQTRYLMLVFPRLMDFDGICAWGDSWNATALYSSPDTTTGADGTWTDHGPFNENNNLLTEMRENIEALTILGARALKLRMHAPNFSSYPLRALHLYGEVSAGENTDRLEIVQTGSTDRVLPAYFDFGDKPRTTTSNRQFRVRNLSSSLTAHDIIVTFDVPTDGSPSFESMHTISADGGTTWLAQVNIGDLAPGATSGVIDLRQVLDEDAVLGLRWGRLLAVPGSWS